MHDMIWGDITLLSDYKVCAYKHQTHKNDKVCAYKHETKTTSCKENTDNDISFLLSCNYNQPD